MTLWRGTNLSSLSLKSCNFNSRLPTPIKWEKKSAVISKVQYFPLNFVWKFLNTELHCLVSLFQGRSSLSEESLQELVRTWSWSPCKNCTNSNTYWVMNCNELIHDLGQELRLEFMHDSGQELYLQFMHDSGQELHLEFMHDSGQGL